MGETTSLASILGITKPPQRRLHNRCPAAKWGGPAAAAENDTPIAAPQPAPKRRTLIQSCRLGDKIAKDHGDNPTLKEAASQAACGKRRNHQRQRTQPDPKSKKSNEGGPKLTPALTKPGEVAPFGAPRSWQPFATDNRPDIMAKDLSSASTTATEIQPLETSSTGTEAQFDFVAEGSRDKVKSETTIERLTTTGETRGWFPAFPEDLLESWSARETHLTVPPQLTSIWQASPHQISRAELSPMTDILTTPHTSSQPRNHSRWILTEQDNVSSPTPATAGANSYHPLPVTYHPGLAQAVYSGQLLSRYPNLNGSTTGWISKDPIQSAPPEVPRYRHQLDRMRQ